MNKETIEQLVARIDVNMKSVATEEGLARLGDRFDRIAWALVRLKIGTVVLSWFLCLALGAAAVIGTAWVWPGSMSTAFRLPPAPDRRLVTLPEKGGTLRVQTTADGTICLFFEGVQPEAGRAKDGRHYLFFRP
jgi:hypothetical protein